MKRLPGSFDNIPGFSSVGKHIGIKKAGKDLAILYSDKLCTVVAVYTQNQIKGAPLYVTQEHLEDHRAQAIVVNSRIANVATGGQGIENARETARIAAQELGIEPGDVLVASTGVIGRQLPMQKIKAGLRNIKQELTPNGDFAEAIMTTDTVKKEICVERAGFRIAGAAKGVGMIEPNMATMLAFLATDAALPTDQLRTALKSSVDKTFNMTSVDTDTSTSDMAILMSNQTVESVVYDDFQETLDYVCRELAKLIAADGEGATKLLLCQVNGAASEPDARRVAKSVISSPLVKTAMYGHDPNWGRLLMAIGKSGAQRLEPNTIAIAINQKPIVKQGVAAPDYDEALLGQVLRDEQEIVIEVDLGLGTYESEAFGCDLSQEYVKINAEYTT